MGCKTNWNWTVVIVTGIGAACGCTGRSTEPDSSSGETAPVERRAAEGTVVEPQQQSRPAAAASSARDEQSEPGAAIAPDVEAANDQMPKVLLTTGQSEECRVFVGDTMPEMTLDDLEGGQQQLSGLYGEKLSVVYLFRGDVAMSHAGLADLGPDVATPYAERGLKVVGVAVQETAEEVKRQIDEAKVTFPMVIDPQGEGMALVGTESLPRVYLLDAQGTILWFDIEYSRSTRRELLQAIQLTLGDP